jgi:hypothetical protein
VRIVPLEQLAAGRQVVGRPRVAIRIAAVAPEQRLVAVAEHHDRLVPVSRRARRTMPSLLLLGSPPFATTDFAPTLFVDVDEAWSRKMQALAAYRAVLDRDYMGEGTCGPNAAG